MFQLNNFQFQNNEFLVILVLLFGAGYLVLLYKYFRLRSKRNYYEKEALRRSQKIIDKAIDEATGIVSKAQIIEDQVKSKIAESTSEISDQQKDVYKKVLDEVRNQLYEVVQKASQDIKEDASSEISAFANSVRAETTATEQEVKNKISEEYVKWERDLEEYKRVKLAEAANDVQRIISEVTKKVLGEALDSANHKDLIIRALEEAKSSGVFGKVEDNESK